MHSMLDEHRITTWDVTNLIEGIEDTSFSSFTPKLHWYSYSVNLTLFNAGTLPKPVLILTGQQEIITTQEELTPTILLLA